MDMCVGDTLKTWNTECLNIVKSIQNIYNKREDELKQIHELWTLDDFFGYLNYINCDKIELNDDIIKKLKLVGINGSTLCEITDSFLILAGVNDVNRRKLIVKCIDDLFDKYGGGKQYNKSQMCCVCTVNEVNTCLVPCGHLVYCKDCGKKSFDHTDKCPICRQKIVTIVTTFPAGLE